METAKIDSLGPLRAMTGLEACVQEETTWLRYSGHELPDQIRQLAVTATYEVREGLLFRPGKPTPVAELPGLLFLPITQAISVELPVSALPGRLPALTLMKLNPSPSEKKQAVLMTDLAAWKRFGETASQVRLDRLTFAVSSEGDVLVMGDPLPSIPGKTFYIIHNLLVPVGYEFEFSVEPVIAGMEKHFPQDSWILFAKEATWTAVPKNYFVAARRSGIRQTSISPAND